jgi:hypothetical protein
VLKPAESAELRPMSSLSALRVNQMVLQLIAEPIPFRMRFKKVNAAR